MRLLFVIDHVGSGGAQRQLTELAIELRRRDHQVHFFLYARDDFHLDRLRCSGIEVFIHPKRSRFSFSPVLDLRRTIRRGNYDVVLSFLPTPNVYAILAGIFLRRKPPLIVSERTSANSVDYGRFHQAIERDRRNAGRLDLYLADSYGGLELIYRDPQMSAM